MSDISRVTIDYMFRDRARVKSMLLCADDQSAFDMLVKECESHGMDAAELMEEALKEQSQKRQAFLGKGAVSGGAAIRVPFTYKENNCR
jgi:hypothetical protein